jgi:hypothetical protein
MIVSVAVEGVSDAAVLRRLCESVGLGVGPEYITRGKARLDQQLRGYNNAARFAPWVVLRDLDHDAPCASALIDELLTDRAEHMYLRVPVRSVESWLIADRNGFSQFFGVARALIPDRPDELERPKRTVVDLARRSSKRSVREGVVPAPGTSTEVGPGYTAQMIEFSSTVWNPESAIENSESLRRCLAALRGIT